MPAPQTIEQPFIGNQQEAENLLRGQESVADIDQQRLFEFQRARLNLKALVNSWAVHATQTETNRALRKLDIDINDLQIQGKIDSDETIIPTRTIDTNIKREQPVFVAYIQQSRRVVTFKDIDMPARDTQVIEEAFSLGMTYEDWMKPHIKTVDGTQLHGWDSVEVMFDTSKPLHVAIEHIGHEKLIFPGDARDIQSLESIVRLYTVTQPQLRQFVKDYGFDAAQVKILLDRYSDIRKNESVIIYKQFFKYEGVVYVAWFELTCTADWLLKPQKLYLGRKEKTVVNVPTPRIDPMTGMPSVDTMTGVPIVDEVPKEQLQPVDEDQYPVFMLTYEELEDERLIMNQGRAFLDKAKQEGLTAIMSGVVNGITRASQIYGSPDQGVGGRPMVNDDVRMVPGRIFTEKINFWSTPWPDVSALTAFQALGTYNDAESGQVNYAAQNRQDSRKTAKEIEVASSEQGLLRSVQITNFSAWLRKIYSFCYKIVKSQALQGKLSFMASHPEMLQYNYDIRAAGDTDVIQRAEKLQRMKQDWPVISQTPLSMPFLIDMLKISYPDEAARYEKMLNEGDVHKLWIQQVLPVLPALMEKLPPNSIPPDQMQQLQQMYQRGQQSLSEL